MKELKSRIFKDGMVIGYSVLHEDGSYTRLDKAQVHMLAQKGLIANVKALSDGGLTGINGFKIKSLSSVYLKNTENKMPITGNHLLAFAARLILNKHNKAKSYDIVEVARYLKNKKIFEIDGYSVSIENYLGNNIKILGQTIEYDISLDDYTYDDVDGIIIGNISKQPITIFRLPYMTLDITPTTLEPDCKLCISKAEFGLLAINQAVNLKFSNCQAMVLSMTDDDKKCINPLYNMLQHFKPIKFTDGYETVYTETEVYPDDLDIYFKPSKNVQAVSSIKTEKKHSWMKIFK